MVQKTNACRLLDQQKIPYETHEIAWDEEHLDAVSVSQKLQIAPTRLYKTLVTTTDQKEIVVACIPAHHHLNLKALAKVSGHKKIEMLPMKDLQKYTGYIRGGCSPIGMKKSYPTFICEEAIKEESLYISAGKRGMQIEISPLDLTTVVHATLAQISTIEAS
ncbi:Cys-tRNA(Pro) deacylase [Isobaculum melis]|uniref:Cys-tRNA(Pro)/Cys-tRNA(Cys) deacylase n=1 Tax=Isobaculum melis TaxID=142588 RepID=A0A1H9SQV0_9LACT|nr:Cys-tRNA(Pro) deacylase [Isobaculum melis]SER86773.1 Cys-tRNA(Pro)/Cys-tRNA(Cys) deacylase [Isobaculum melis]